MFPQCFLSSGIRIVNSDPGLHNVHAIPSVNAEFNFAQPLQGLENVRTFTQPEIMVPFQCDLRRERLSDRRRRARTRRRS
jgi:hypothetical protein